MSVAFGQDLEFTDSVNISREQWRDSLLRIDKSQVPTGFLFEYSLAGIDLSKFNGVNSDTLKNEGQILSLHEILNLSKEVKDFIKYQTLLNRTVLILRSTTKVGI